MSALRVIAVAGGKGGVGKTQVAVNLGVIAAADDARVLLIDGDVGLSNADLLLDVRPRSGLVDVALGRAAIEDALVTSPFGVTLLAGAHGDVASTRLGDAEKLALLGALDSLGEAFDVVIIDTASGLGADALFFAGAADEVVIVTTPEPTALADTYATLRALARHHGQRRFQLVVNQAEDKAQAIDVHERIRILARRFVQSEVSLLGWVPFDLHVHEAVMRHAPVVAVSPRAPASRQLRHAAHHLLAPADSALATTRSARPTIQFFWRHVLGYPPARPVAPLQSGLGIQDEPS
ncbi:MAG: AAA family ATPase [Deltaproteobacteria bacterium]|nr:AAA family ATPase [Deltaproteobacteria bacterium]